MPEPRESTIAVVGAGLAGLRVCERLRAAGHTGHIVVLGDEQHPPYNRPPLSKELLRGTMTRDQLPFRQRAATEDVEWRLGSRVEQVDLDDAHARPHRWLDRRLERPRRGHRGAGPAARPRR